MSKIDDLLEIEPFSLAPNKKEKIFMEAVRESLVFHYNNCENFRKFCKKRGFNPYGKYGLTEVPFLPVEIFKTVKLISVKEENISKNVFSSSTSGNIPSSIFLDDVTSKRQRKSLNKIVSSFIGPERKIFIIFDAEKTITSKDGKLSSRAAAIRGMLPFMKKAFFILDENLELDRNSLRMAVNSVGKSERVCFLGFTFLFYETMKKNANKKDVVNLFKKISGSYVLHLGGWKRLQNLKIEKLEFNSDLSLFLHTKPKKVIDVYGMTEQLGTIYLDCEYGYKHVPVYSDIIIRDIKTLKPAKDGNSGLIQLISPLPNSYPGVSIISDDIGVIVNKDGCKCGRKGKFFLFRNRAEKAELKGCGDTLRNGL